MSKVLNKYLDCETDFFTECHKRKLSPKAVREARHRTLLEERIEIAKALQAEGYGTNAIGYATKAHKDTVRYWISGY